MERIELFRIFSDQVDIDAVTNIISRGSSWAGGPEIARFESLLAEYMGVKDAIVFNSGTSAQHTLLLSHRITTGEVIVPSFTFISTVNTVEIVGARPVFADIEEKTFGLDPVEVNEKVTDKTRAIVTVHYAGTVCSGIKALREIANDNDLVLIEDTAESMGASIDGSKAGTIGNSAILSFCQNKIITTGEGGAIITDDVGVAKRARLIRSHGREERRGEDYFTSHRKMDYIEAGMNLRMPTINAALGIAQLSKIDRLIDMRKKNASLMTERLHRIKGVHIPIFSEKISPVYQMYPILLDTRETRDGLKEHLSSNGIASKVYFDPVHREKYYLEKYPDLSLPLTEAISERILSLPFYPGMSIEEIDAIHFQVRRFLDD